MNKSQMLQSVRNYLSIFPESNEDKEKIIKVMGKIERKDFMEENKTFSYEDSARSIGYGQTISQPSTVARMLLLLKLKKTDEVLEVGTGSGWGGALLGELSKKVMTLEIVKELAKKAEKKIKKQNIPNVKVKQDNFAELKQKFNKIIFTAGISGKRKEEKIIENFAKTHLKENGILVCPYQSGSLIIFSYKNGKIKKDYTKEQYVFVPLILE